jgi:hypothetical protein
MRSRRVPSRCATSRVHDEAPLRREAVRHEAPVRHEPSRPAPGPFSALAPEVYAEPIPRQSEPRERPRAARPPGACPGPRAVPSASVRRRGRRTPAERLRPRRGGRCRGALRHAGIPTCPGSVCIADAASRTGPRHQCARCGYGARRASFPRSFGDVVEYL